MKHPNQKNHKLCGRDQFYFFMADSLGNIIIWTLFPAEMDT